MGIDKDQSKMIVLLTHTHTHTCTHVHTHTHTTSTYTFMIRVGRYVYDIPLGDFIHPDRHSKLMSVWLLMMAVWGSL